MKKHEEHEKKSMHKKEHHMKEHHEKMHSSHKSGAKHGMKAPMGHKGK